MDNNTPTSLDLYAKVEDLLGVKEFAPKLYAHYLLFLNTTSFESMLDIGCGSGDFLLQMRKALDIPIVKGIDLSPVMVAKTAKLGIETECINLCDIKGTFDVLTAVFDMLNYLDHDSLKSFLLCVKSRLNAGGVFLCDINTLYGFKNVAVGSFIVDDDTRFLTVDSDFEENEYRSEFTLFEKKDNNSFRKSQEEIKQYYYAVDEIVKYSGLELLVCDDVSLYDFEEADKCFIVLKKV